MRRRWSAAVLRVCSDWLELLFTLGPVAIRAIYQRSENGALDHDAIRSNVQISRIDCQFDLPSGHALDFHAGTAACGPPAEP